MCIRNKSCRFKQQEFYMSPRDDPALPPAPDDAELTDDPGREEILELFEAFSDIHYSTHMRP